MKARTWLLLLVLLPATSLPAQDAKLQSDVKAAIVKAGHYYATKVAYRGGYVYFYSPDLKQRFGEGPASATEIWVQPPGTPTVGLALLEGFRATGDEQLRTAATDAALALIYGQLKSGAWTGSIDFNPQTADAAYRNGKGRGKNFSTLDDGTSQGALQLLMQVDKAHEFNHREIHQAAQIAIDALLNAQFSTGGFPQGWDETPAPKQQPETHGAYPKYDWRTEGRIKEYWDLYTLNDGAAGTIADTLLMASDVYDSERYRTALRKLGDFLILSQMPNPQPAWAQQYNYDMNPVWARRFEPPAVAGRESQDVISALMKIYVATNDKKYLQPIPAALKYLKRSALSDGRLARYYELQSNRPLYMSRVGKDYSLTYDDSDLPSHYGWKVENRVAELQARYDELTTSPARTDSAVATVDQVKAVLRSLDDQGRWVSTFAGERLIGQQKFRPGDQYLSSELFSSNVRLLSHYLQP